MLSTEIFTLVVAESAALIVVSRVVTLNAFSVRLRRHVIPSEDRRNFLAALWHGFDLFAFGNPMCFRRQVVRML